MVHTFIKSFNLSAALMFEFILSGMIKYIHHILDVLGIKSEEKISKILEGSGFKIEKIFKQKFPIDIIATSPKTINNFLSR